MTTISSDITKANTTVVPYLVHQQL